MNRGRMGVTQRRKKMELKWITDAGHGWLKVRTRDVAAKYPEILSKVSGYSYMNNVGSVLYLEEDQDCALLLEAMIADGSETRETLREIPEFYEGAVSSIRRLKHYTNLF